MGSAPRAIADGFPARLALFYAGLFVVVGVQMPFFPVWLKAKGLDAEAIGLVIATPILVRVLVVPVAARFADRRGALRPVLVVSSFGAAIGYVLVGASQGFAAILASVALAAALAAPAIPLADAYALKGLALRGRAYGPVRLWGSAAFIAANFAAGFAAGYIAPTSYVWLIVAAWALAGAASLALQPLRPAGVPAPARPWRPRRLLATPGVLPVAVGASLIQASHAVYYGFSTIEWGAKGLSGTSIGALWALGVAAEIVLFALSARLPALSPRGLLILGAAGAVVRWAGMVLDPPAVLLVPLQCLHALSFGASFLGAVQFLSRAAPEGEAATAQGDFSTLQGVVTAAATAVSGLLYGSFGALAYAAMAVCAAVGGIVIWSAQVSGNRYQGSGSNNSDA
ncbi:MAG: MFS transporter [Bradyrhizobiaceae bacterium]|nr:MFS transporter [Hyphomicrobiales bacterium]MBV9428741.1 MFS transporter [Bradyrhizobiaceae bacterium]